MVCGKESGYGEGIQGSVRDTGGGSSSSPVEVLFLRVEGYNLKKRKIFYSKNYYYYRLPPPEPETAAGRGRDQFFSQTHIYIRHTPAKKPHPTGGVVGKVKPT